MLLPEISKNKNILTVEIVAALVISLLAGIVASTGQFIYIVALIAVVIAIPIALSPTVLLFSMILVGLVFTGLFRTYLPQLEYIRWALLPGSIALIFHAFFAVSTRKIDYSNNKIPAIIWWVLVFFLVTVSSSVINDAGLKSHLVGSKGYLQVWGVLFALTFINYDKKTVEIIPKMFLVIAFIQLPFVLQQFFILAPSRVGIARGIVPIDVVSGTFGISAMGGNNALLTAYLYICIAGAIALWQEKVWTTKRTLIVCALLFWPTMINEAKIGFIFLIAIFSILFFTYIFSSLQRFLLSILSLLLVSSILLWSFVVHVDQNEKISNPIELLQYTYRYNIQKDESFSGDLSKFGTFKYWYEMHGVDNIRNTIIGHGVGISRQTLEQKNSISGPLDVVASIGIGKTAFSAILWETGIMGLLVVIGLFISGFVTAVKLSNRYADNKRERAIFRGISAALAILFISFMSKGYFVYQAAYQTILFTLLGYLTYWERRPFKALYNNNQDE